LKLKSTILVNKTFTVRLQNSLALLQLVMKQIRDSHGQTHHWLKSVKIW